MADQFNDDEINHPKHYTSHPSGIECIQVVRHMRFNEGNVVKYLWRSGLKVAPGEDDAKARLRDLKKAQWYLNDAIAMAEIEAKDEHVVEAARGPRLQCDGCGQRYSKSSGKGLCPFCRSGNIVAREGF